MTFHGTVVKKAFARGSKSEHDAVILRTEKQDLVLRRRGGNAFSDPVLSGLVGKQIQADGEIIGHTLLLDAWSEGGAAL